MCVRVCTYIRNLLHVRVGVGLDLQLSDMLDFRETETPGNYSEFLMTFCMQFLSSVGFHNENCCFTDVNSRMNWTA